MKTAIYPGSFNPFHDGHDDIIKKSLMVFDKVLVVKMINPEKINNGIMFGLEKKYGERVEQRSWDGLLVDYIKGCEIKIDAVIRGLRNGHDLQYEMNNQYWNEDLGLKIPIVYFVCDRSLSHISSSAIRSLEKFKT